MMAVYLRGIAWHYDFQIQGERFRGSCGDTCKSKTRAKQIEDDRRGEVLAGIGGPSRKAPLLSAYSVPFLEWVDGCVKAGSLADKTGKYYRNGVRLLSATPAWNMRLDKITSEVAAMLTFPRSASTANNGLRTLRHMLGQAAKKRTIRAAPEISLREENERTVIIEPWLEELMLEKAPEPLRSVIIIMLDNFMRPAEVVAMRWEDVLWERNLIWIPKSKTKRGRRHVGMTRRIRLELELRKQAGPWVYPSTGGKSGRKSISGHILSGSLDKMWATMKAHCLVAIAQRKLPAWPDGLVLYSCRHTGATNYSGLVGNEIKVANALGHADTRITRRYVHLGVDSGKVMDEHNETKLEIVKRRA